MIGQIILQNYQLMQTVAIPRNPIFKNLRDTSLKESRLFPYRTQGLRMIDFPKSRIASIKRLQKQKINLTDSEQAPEMTILIKQIEENRTKQRKVLINQEKLKSPSIFRKKTNSHFDMKTNGSITLNSTFAQNNSILTEKKRQSPELKHHPINSQRQTAAKQKQTMFRKTFCSSLQKPYKNRSLQMRNIQRRPPTTQAQTNRPLTRIRKVSNIGEQTNNNFLAKYEIIKQLGKGTYGTVYLAKVIKKKIQQNCLLNSVTLNLSNMITNQSEMSGKNQYSQTKKVYNSSLITENQSSLDNFIKGYTQELSNRKDISQLQTIYNSKVLSKQIVATQRDQKYLNLNDSNGQTNEKLEKVKIEPKDQQKLNEKTQKNISFGLQEIDKQKQICIMNEPNNEICEDDELVAIKVYQKFKMNKDPAKFKNIRKQITIMQNLSHSGVIKLYQSVQSITKISLVVEFGGDLSLLDYLRKNFPLTKDKLKDFSKQLLETIIYLHDKNIVHRDIKLQNILVKVDKNNSNQQKLKLIDYGFSTLTNKSRKLNVICGTPNFMAPELLSSKEYFGEKADTWSFGVVIFVMAEGRHPFKSADYQQLSRVVNKGKYTFKRKHEPLFEQFIGNILKLNSQQRPTAVQISRFKWLQQQ